MDLTLEQFGIDRLSAADRIDLIGMIWDSIDDAERVALVPAWHLEELARRKAAAEASPQASIPWEEVQARLSRNT